LIQTFLAGYLVQTLLFDKAIPTDALMISSILGFISIPLLGWLSDKVGRRLPYIILNISAIILAYPMLSIIVDKSYAPGTIMLCIIVIHNFAVLGLFALENITMAEMFGSRNRFTRMAISKEAGGLVAVGFGPVLAGDLLQYDRLLVADCRHAGGLFRDWTGLGDPDAGSARP